MTPDRPAQPARNCQHALGKLIRELRNFGSLSQEDLADLWALRQPAISKIERKDDLALRALMKLVYEVGARLRLTVEIGGREIVLESKKVPGSKNLGTR